ncbi:MAG TPA: ArsR family transcriptional regulator [bacterium]|nr:ArsR family transcriptional regulator [bacterium]
MNEKVKQKFIETWGAMGSLWGINTSVARVHALLMVSEKPLGLDDISEELKISRGNASMCLKELRNWGVIKKARETGDRRDFYLSEDDVWTMFIRIVRERKRRELDPAVDSVRKVLAESKDDGSDPKVKARFSQMNEMLETMNSLAEAFLKSDEDAKAALSLLSNMVKMRD